MIRKLTETDRQDAIDFVSEKPAENLFIILRAILLKFTDNFIVYAPDEFDAEGIADIVNRDRDFKFLSGIESIAKSSPI